MKRNLWLLALCQGLYITNNTTFIAINGLVGLMLAPLGWMATLPVMGYVVGSALSTSLVARSQSRFGRKISFQLGLVVALLAALLCAWAAIHKDFWLLCSATLVAGYYNTNAQLYRFAAAELAGAGSREKAMSMVMAGGLLGAVAGPALAVHTRGLLPQMFAGAYLALTGVAVLSMLAIAAIDFPPEPPKSAVRGGRPTITIVMQPVFLASAVCGALSYGVMNLLMAASPIAMQQCGLPFSDAAFVLEWHAIGMFLPGFFTGNLIKRVGSVPVMAAGVVLLLVCVGVALSGIELQHFVISMLLLGVGWNFLFTGSSTLALNTYRPEERDRAQGAINLFMFVTMALSSLASGMLVTTQGWSQLNIGSLVPVVVSGGFVVWLMLLRARAATSPAS